MKTNCKINEREPIVISFRVRKEWGKAEAMLREVCRREEMTRTQAIVIHGDPRQWKAFGTLPLPERPAEDDPCEGCGSPAVTSDSDGVPLCQKCADACKD